MNHTHREYKRSSDWTNLPFALLTEEQIQKRIIMARILEHSFSIESRAYNERYNNNQADDTYNDDIHKAAIFRLFDDLLAVRQAEMKEYVQLIVDETGIHDEHELSYLRWAAEDFYWSQEIPPR